MFPKMEKLVCSFYILATVFPPSSPPTPFSQPLFSHAQSSTPSFLFGKEQVFHDYEQSMVCQRETRM